MENIYKFSVPKVIKEIAYIIIKNENDYEKNEEEMLLGFIWLGILDSFTENELQQKLEALFKFFKKQTLTKELLMNLDKQLCSSNNEEIKKAYLKYPIHDAMSEYDWKETNINRYLSQLNKIKTYVDTTTPNYIYEFLLAKNALDKMIDDIKVIAELIITKNQKGVLNKIINYKEIQRATKSIEEFKSIWKHNSNVVYKNISKDEKQMYEILLGERLKNA